MKQKHIHQNLRDAASQSLKGNQYPQMPISEQERFQINNITFYL